MSQYPIVINKVLYLFICTLLSLLSVVVTPLSLMLFIMFSLVEIIKVASAGLINNFYVGIFKIKGLVPVLAVIFHLFTIAS